MATLLQFDVRAQAWLRQVLADTPVLIASPDESAQALAVAVAQRTAAPPPGALAWVYPVALAHRTAFAHLTRAHTVFRNADLQPLPSLTVLRDRDCLTYYVADQAHRLFFDAFTAPVVQVYDGQAAACGFCREPLTPDLSVRCPGCGIRFHQTDASACWLASDACPTCMQPTTLESAATWIPEGLFDAAALTGDGA